MRSQPHQGVRNALLRQLRPDEFRRLREQMQETVLEFRQPIYEQDKPVKDIYFPNTGVISMIVEQADGGVIEAGTVGYEGMSGVPAARHRVLHSCKSLVAACGYPRRSSSPSRHVRAAR
jgi:CRP-like cAMP-binding protein